MTINRRSFLSTAVGSGAGITCATLTSKAFCAASQQAEKPDYPPVKTPDEIYFAAIDAWVKIEYSTRRSGLHPTSTLNFYSHNALHIRGKHVSAVLKDYYLYNNRLPDGMHDLGDTDADNVFNRSVPVGELNFSRISKEIEYLAKLIL